MNQLLATAGIVCLLGTGYANLSDNYTEQIEEAHQTAAVLQSHQLEVALEMYYNRHGGYPEARDEAVVSVLQNNDFLKNGTLGQSVVYVSTKNGQRYTLELSK